MSETLSCSRCGGWTQNEDGHRDDCPTRERDPDAIMLLVWEQWAKREGNDGAAQLFRRCADRLSAPRATEIGGLWALVEKLHDAVARCTLSGGREALWTEVHAARAELATALRALVQDGDTRTCPKCGAEVPRG